MIVALPGFSALMRPLESTFTTFLLELVKVAFSLLEIGLQIGTSVNFFPFFRVMDFFPPLNPVIFVVFTADF